MRHTHVVRNRSCCLIARLRHSVAACSSSLEAGSSFTACTKRLYAEYSAAASHRSYATTGNKHLGPPCNLNGQTCNARSQLPFLLRWPPQQLSQFLPDVFAWDEASNRLSLRDHHRSQPPWKARPHHRRVDATEQWLYCATCHPTLFEQEDKQAQCRVPFRDATSLAGVRGVAAVPRLLDPPEAWTRATADAARANPQRGGSLSFENLVPRPDPE